MNSDRYYVADQEISLATAAERQRLTQRLPQYLELRNVGILLGNGASIPLGSPTLNNTKDIRGELEQEPNKLSKKEDQEKAIKLLDLLLPTDKPPITLETFLGVINNIITNAQSLPSTTTVTINKEAVTIEEAQALDTLVKKWLYHRCHRISNPTTEELKHHRELLRRTLLERLGRL